MTRAVYPTLIELRDDVAAGRRSAVELTRETLTRISEQNPALFALNQVFDQAALRRAEAIDQDRRSGRSFGPLGGLAGVPLALKDNICLSPQDAGDDQACTTAGSRILESYRSPFTATAARKLLDAGAVVVAKANLDEFAMGSTTEHSAFGPTCNPFDPARSPGGSSGGSAAAVASGMVPGALGSDTGGSIRQPAGWCNLVGLKPTYGRVSRYGLIAYASSLDQIGPLTRTVADAALLGSIISGADPHDSTSADLPAPNWLAELDTPIDKLVLGVPRQARSAANHPAVAAALERAIQTFASLGAVVVDTDLPHADYGIAAYYIIATAEASSNLARLDGVRYGRRAALRPGDDLMALYCRSRAEGFGAEAQRRIMLGTHVLSSGYYDAYYTTALKVRRLIKQDFDQIFSGQALGTPSTGCHAVLMPSSPGPALKLGEKASDPMSLYLEDIYTVGVNLAGLPGVTVPAGSAGTLPIGLQLIGPALGESTILRIARMLEASQT